MQKNQSKEQLNQNETAIQRKKSKFGVPLGDDGIWLAGPTGTVLSGEKQSDKQIAKLWGARRMLLAEHLLVFKKLGPIWDQDDESDNSN